MQRLKHFHERGRDGFTVVELLASMALLAGIMVILVSTVDQTQRVWRRSTDKASQFQGARAAFDTMTRRLSQATLNAYWKTFDTDIDADKSNLRYRRQSELQFISGPSTRIFGTAPALSELATPIESAYPTHAVFFQAPLGYTEELDKGSGQVTQKFRTLDSLLTGCGYFIEYGPDSDRPEFLENVQGISDRFRFRLMEMNIPSERLSIYQRPKDSKGFNDPRIFDENKNFPYLGLVDKLGRPETAWVRPLWMKDALMRVQATGGAEGRKFRFARPRAENIVALIVLPKLAERDRKNIREPELAPNYQYDSWRILLRGINRIKDGNSTVEIDNVARDNLLPPIVQVTMVAVDETSMTRMNLRKDNIPTWTEGLFENAQTEDRYYEDMDLLEKKRLQKDNLNYRIFTTDVVIRASKWSRDPAIQLTP